MKENKVSHKILLHVLRQVLHKKIFEEFYAENFKKLVNKIKYHKIGKEDAQDLAQDIMLELFERYDDIYILKNEGWFWRYLVRNRILDFLSAKKEKYGGK